MRSYRLLELRKPSFEHCESGVRLFRFKAHSSLDAVQVQSAHDKSAATCAEAEARLRVIETTIRVGREQRTPSSSRDQQLQSLSKTEQEIASLKNELEQQHATDPATVKRNLDLLEVARSSAVGHTENIAILVKFAQQWLQVERDAVVCT